MIYFADTYALIEYLNGNPAYEKYFQDTNEIVTSKLNLMELYYSSLADGFPEKAEKEYNQFLSHITTFSDEDIKHACQFRYTYRKQNVSYIDAMGYCIAQTKKAKFLTGDNAFKEMENVEWVK